MRAQAVQAVRGAASTCTQHARPRALAERCLPAATAPPLAPKGAGLHACPQVGAHVSRNTRRRRQRCDCAATTHLRDRRALLHCTHAAPAWCRTCCMAAKALLPRLGPTCTTLHKIKQGAVARAEPPPGSFSAAEPVLASEPSFVSVRPVPLFSSSALLPVQWQRSPPPSAGPRPCGCLASGARRLGQCARPSASVLPSTSQR